MLPPEMSPERAELLSSPEPSHEDADAPEEADLDVEN